MQFAVDFFNRGGWAMWLLLFAAIIGFSYIIERFITFLRARIDPEEFANDLIKTFQDGGVNAAIKYCAQVPSPVARILQPVLEKYKQIGKEKEILEEVLTRVATTELTFLDRGMLVLASVSNIAPMIGFLGTVSGMIRAFNSIALAGTVEPTLVASGISEALITTATGLALAIPISGAHAFFTQKVNAYTRSMEEAAAGLMDALLEA
ncbi:MotA/TolQ/ExbB proton channel family protein [candidate division WOR-3 bacterium]|nr:MotA/TolQ/ExbB proton channel family protein [candidate division WOR-3 bacterium]MCK4526755.1 MotA/TolQ/ExbB proton channel family protein [candidate division WOR-3 bacterium]